MERQGTNWEKRIGNHISDKGFIFRIYEEMSNINRIETKYLLK